MIVYLNTRIGTMGVTARMLEQAVRKLCEKHETHNSDRQRKARQWAKDMRAARQLKRRRVDSYTERRLWPLITGRFVRSQQYRRRAW